MSTAGIRYAALRLAALHPRDRDWLLQRLPGSVRDAWHALVRTPGWEARARLAATLPPPVAAVSDVKPLSHPAVVAADVDIMPAATAEPPEWPALAAALKDSTLPPGLAGALVSWRHQREEAA